MRKDARLVCNAGPGRTQSLRETLSCSRAEASNTILHSVVCLSVRRTAWYVKCSTGHFHLHCLDLVLPLQSLLYILIDPSGVSFSFLGLSFQLSILSSRFTVYAEFINCSLELDGFSSWQWNLIVLAVKVQNAEFINCSLELDGFSSWQWNLIVLAVKVQSVIEVIDF